MMKKKKSDLEKHGYYINKIKTLKNFRHDLQALAQRSSLRRSLTWSILIATSTDKPTVKPIFSTSHPKASEFWARAGITHNRVPH